MPRGSSLTRAVRAKTNRCSAGSEQPPRRCVLTHGEGLQGGGNRSVPEKEHQEHSELSVKVEAVFRMVLLKKCEMRQTDH